MKKQRKAPGRLKVLRTTVRSLASPALRAANGAYDCYAWPTLGGSCVTCNAMCGDGDCDYTR